MIFLLLDFLLVFNFVLKYPDIMPLFRWLRCLKSGSMAARLLGLRVRIPPWGEGG